MHKFFVVLDLQCQINMNLVFHISEDGSKIESKHCASSETSVKSSQKNLGASVSNFNVTDCLSYPWLLRLRDLLVLIC